VVLPWGGGSAHILDGTGNIVAKNFTFTEIDPETGEELASETFSPGKKVGLEGDLRTCTAGPFTEFDPELGREITFLITVEALFTLGASSTVAPTTIRGRGLTAPARPLVSIHPSAWKGCSPKSLSRIPYQTSL
jgi:hypothetical protein